MNEGTHSIIGNRIESHGSRKVVFGIIDVGRGVLETDVDLVWGEDGRDHGHLSSKE